MRESLDSKTALVEAGMDLFLAHSYQGTGINEILKQVGVPKGSFYHHFTSKEQYALAVIARYREKLEENMAETFGKTSLSPTKRIVAFMQRIMRDIVDSDYTRGCPFGSFGHELSTISNTLRQPIEEAFAAIHATLTDCIKKGVQDGSIRGNESPAHMATFLMAATQGAILMAKVKRDRSPLDEVLKSARLYLTP
ncbi:MAG: TetR/AcrR family transcriptional regulator [Planctomycetaceae bacterium]|nr:TetR/AcrR family transcriptional regulator [Planctomycetaceae bacterium]